MPNVGTMQEVLGDCASVPFELIVLFICHLPRASARLWSHPITTTVIVDTKLSVICDALIPGVAVAKLPKF